MAHRGSWAGDRIVIVGDYSDELPSFLTEEEATLVTNELTTKSKNLYSLADDKYEEVSASPEEWFDSRNQIPTVAPASMHQVFASVDGKEYIEPMAFGSLPNIDYFLLEQGGILKALFSCLFHSEGGGGGDQDCLGKGRWAGHRIQLMDRADTVREGCEDASPAVLRLLREAEQE